MFDVNLTGWSHGLFHLVCSLSSPVMVKVALGLLESKDQIELAVRCTILNEMYL